ncbi:hypothetical protein Bca52824_032993 [Brassica carinata]|uniref:Uncharacterized protein n=1 Tax=Brassica carinata TaxID=52824 RepID=A0A8X7SDI0_BRACI|nr:hypothetical protein Bca52824_032993 [Brassica carinata]
MTDEPVNKSSLSGSRPNPLKKKEIDENDDEKPLSKRNSSVGLSKVKKKREKKVYDLPGQKRDQPDERDPLSIFYETLRKQLPTSEIAKIW